MVSHKKAKMGFAESNTDCVWLFTQTLSLREEGDENNRFLTTMVRQSITDSGYDLSTYAFGGFAMGIWRPN